MNQKKNLNNFNIDLGFMTKLENKNSFYINNEYENILFFIEFEFEDNNENFDDEKNLNYYLIVKELIN